MCGLFESGAERGRPCPRRGGCEVFLRRLPAEIFQPAPAHFNVYIVTPRPGEGGTSPVWARARQKNPPDPVCGASSRVWLQAGASRASLLVLVFVVRRRGGGDKEESLLLLFLVEDSVLLVLVLGDEVANVLVRLLELHLVHTFSLVPMQECLSLVHGSKLRG